MLGEVVVNTSISPNYFWFEMSYGELISILDCISKNNREQWEMIRFNSYLNNMSNVPEKNIQSYTPQSLFPFQWDKDTHTTKEKKVYSKAEKDEIINRLSSKKATNKVAKI
jgi:hypothetical protein